MRLRVRGDLVAAPDELAHVVPREVAVVLADPVRDDAERAAPAALLQHGRRDEEVVLERIVERERHAERSGGGRCGKQAKGARARTCGAVRSPWIRTCGAARSPLRQDGIRKGGGTIVVRHHHGVRRKRGGKRHLLPRAGFVGDAATDACVSAGAQNLAGKFQRKRRLHVAGIGEHDREGAIGAARRCGEYAAVSDGAQNLATVLPRG